MRTVHKVQLTNKYDVLATTTVPFNAPEGLTWLHVANQNDEICVWYEVDTSQPTGRYVLHIVGTGQAIPERATRYVGTALMADGNFVFHVYEETV